MTPQEKALELVKKFYPILGGINPADWEYFNKEEAKQCAIIAVDEIIAELPEYLFGHPILVEKRINYYEEVKTEIEKL